MEDEQFKRTLQALAGDAGDWEDFDPSSWRAIKAAGGDEGESGVSAAQEGDAWDSDDSAAMVLNLHKLSLAERSRTGGRKLNKARQFAAEPEVLRDAAELETVTWNETGLAMGEVSPTGATFVPWRLVLGYPDMYVGKRNSQRAAPLFTLEALHENRVWDLYYIHRPQPTDKKPVVFVPTYQFQHLLDVVNVKLETQLTIPPGSNEDKFNMSFGISSCPRPRFLGRSTSRESFENLRNAIPAPNPVDNLKNATQRGREQFLKNLRMADAARSKKKKSDKNRVKRIMVHKAWGRSIKRVQRYLGLRQRATDGTDPSTDAPRVLDLSLPMAQKPEGSVVFMAIDVEAWEHDQKVATEVGMALLDTADLQGVAPGDGGRNWFSLIQARHFRIKENSWALNKHYVQGYPDRFNFGMSEFIEGSAVASVVKRLIEGGSFVDKLDGAAEQRHVILVFHESSSDIKYIGELGYDVSSAKNVVEVVDTKEMHQCVVRSKNSSSLGSVLGSLQIRHKYLHNAGNDAVYTLQAMIGLAIKKRLHSLENAATDNQQPIPFSELKEQEGWTSGGEDSDGGDAVNRFSRINPQADCDDEDYAHQAW